MGEFVNLQGWETIALVLCGLGVLIVGVAIALLYLAAQSIRDIDIPEDADFFETMQAVPITIPIALDMLDLVLDVFSAPISWIILDMMGLGALKMVTLVEGFIPGTQFIPTMTIGWVISRVFIKDKKSAFRERMREAQAQNRMGVPRRGGLESGGSRADVYRNMALPPGQRAGRMGSDVIVEERGAVRPRRSGNRPPSALPGGVRSGNDDFIEGEYTEDPTPRGRRGTRRNDYDDYAASEDWEEGDY